VLVVLLRCSDSILVPLPERHLSIFSPHLLSPRSPGSRAPHSQGYSPSIPAHMEFYPIPTHYCGTGLTCKHALRVIPSTHTYAPRDIFRLRSSTHDNNCQHHVSTNTMHVSWWLTESIIGLHPPLPPPPNTPVHPVDGRHKHCSPLPVASRSDACQ
jgi:hypothetical protein